MSRATRSTLSALSGLALLLLAACGGHSKPSATPTPTSASPSSSATPAAPPTCPLTGQPPTKTQKRDRPALAVKIDNVDVARPQTGVDRADIVFEETVEGGLTRLFAVFQCDSAASIGPVRSARTSDSDLIQLLRTAVFGYSGANSRVNARILATPGAIALSYDANGSLFHRSSSRPAPHNVYSSTSTLLSAGLSRSKKLKPPPPMFTYSPSAPAGSTVHSIALRWSGFASAAWGWTGKAWNRSQNGSPDVLTDGHRISAQNVVVMRITTRFLGLHDVLGNASPDDVVTGHGRVWVFRNGRMVRGVWTRKNARSPLRLTLRGRVIALQPGHTWVELLPPAATISISKH
jgi:hypothetical protein